MTWTAEEIRQLRYRLGWSRAEMARNLKVEPAIFTKIEDGTEPLSIEMTNSLIHILGQAESLADKIQRRPIAEVMMKDRGLSQIHDFDVIDGLGDKPDTPTRGNA